MKTHPLLVLLLLLLARPTQAQVGMNGQPHPSAALDVKATDKAFYPPRLTSVQRKAIANPQPGALVYDLDQSTLYLYDGGNWLPMSFQSPNSVMPTTRIPNDGGNGGFGVCVAISGDYAIVGASAKTIGSNDSQGAAYIFVRSGNVWTQQAQLLATDGASIDQFGVAVALSGNYAIVGADRKDVGTNANQGAAYVFMRQGNSWTQQARLTASNGMASDEFGRSVAISGTLAFVGTTNRSVNGNGGQGAVYVFERSGTNWTQQAQLTASDGAANDNFGEAIAWSGSYLLVGVPNKTIGSNAQQGAAYVFTQRGTGWIQTRLPASAGAAYDYFGKSVAISGDYAIVGCPNRDIGSNVNQGAAYVFVRETGNSWIFQDGLSASDGVSNDNFGSSVAISGDYALVGAAYKDIGSNHNQGAAYVYKRSGLNWSLNRSIIDNSPALTSFGQSAAMSDGYYIIGGWGKVAFGVLNN